MLDAAILWVLIFTRFYVRNCFGLLILQRHLNQNLTISLTVNVYEGVPWMNVVPGGTDLMSNLHNAEGTIPIINLNRPINGYNPCDSSTFDKTNEEGWLMVTRSNKMRENDTRHDWVGIVDPVSLMKLCGKVPLHFFFTSYSGWSAQKLGANAVVVISKTSTNDKLSIPPYANAYSGKVWDIVVTIPVLTVATSEFVVNGIIDSQVLLGASSDWSITSLITDSNPTDVLYQRFGLIHLVTIVMLAYCFLLILLIIWQLKKVSQREFVPVKRIAAEPESANKGQGDTVITSKKADSVAQTVSSITSPPLRRNPVAVDESRMARQRSIRLRYLTLWGELIVSVLRFITFLDYMGLFHIVFDFCNARLLIVLAEGFSTFCNVMMTLYCYDSYRLIKAGRSMKRTTSLFYNHPQLITAIVSITLMMILVLEICTAVALQGYPYLTLLMIIYFAFTDMVVVISSVRLNNIALKEIAEVRKQYSNSTTGAIKNDSLLDTINRFDTTRKFMIRSAFGICLFLIGTLSSGYGVTIVSWELVGILFMTAGPLIATTNEVLAVSNYLGIGYGKGGKPVSTNIHRGVISPAVTTTELKVK